MAELADVFWSKRSYDPNREKFFEGLLYIIEYLLDKTLDEGKALLRKVDPNAIHIEVPFGPKMRKTIFEHLKFVNTTYRMAGFEIYGIPGLADIFTDIRIFLPQKVRDVTSFGRAGGRKMSLETFRDVLIYSIQDFKRAQEFQHSSAPFGYRRSFYEDE